MIWFELLVAIIAACIILYIPGCIFLSGLQLRLTRIVIYAPLLTIFLYSFFAIVYGVFGIYTSFATLFIPVFGLAAVTVPFSRRMLSASKTSTTSKHTLASKRTPKIDLDTKIALVFLVFGIAVVIRFFILTLDEPNSFVQDSDNSFHLALVRSFLDSGNYSPLHATLYPDASAITLPLVDTSSSFYPSAWHCLCAMVVSALGTSIPLATNAVNFVLLAVVFPLSTYSWLSSLFRKRNLIVLCGAFLCLACCAFPWGAVFPPSGPLYPNLIGFCFLPALCSVFIDLIDKDWTFRRRVAFAGLFAIGTCSCALAHPNVVFAAAVMLIPFCISRIYTATYSRLGKSRATMLSAGFLLFAIACWLIAYSLPPLQSTVRFEWEPFTNVPRAILACLTLSLRFEGLHQWLLGGLVLLGAAVLTIKRRGRWIVLSWAVSCFFFVVCASTDGELENVLTGFWYTDPYRVAILVAINALPLACVGCATLIEMIRILASRLAPKAIQRKEALPAICCIVLIPIILTTFRSTNEKWGDESTSPFGNIDFVLTVANDSERKNTIDPDERKFIKEVADLVDPSYQIYNCADDGSPFAYPLEGLNLCYRRSAAETLKSENPDAGILRTHINQLATNARVQEILDASTIRYILVLDLGGENIPDRCYYGYYWRQKWLGINSIDDETPGLKTLLSRGDMRLYEIERDAD